MERSPALIALVFTALFAFQSAFSQTKAGEFRTIHVKFKEQFKPDATLNGQSARSGMTGVDRISEKHKALSIKRIFPEAGKYEAAHKAYGLHLWYEIKFRKDVRLNDAIADYENLKYFHNVEECKEYTTGWESKSTKPELPTGTNDPLFTSQWHFNNTGQTGGTGGADINLLKAWQTETGSKNIIVAVIDGGINLKHPDLVDALWTNNDEIPFNGIDDDNNGYADDINGYSFGDRSPVIYPDEHATHVAGTIGAVSNNGIGVSGIAGGSGSGDGVRLMSCAGFGLFGTGGFEAAMVYAADNGAVISQNSWGGGSNAIEAAIDYFVNRAGLDNKEINFAKNIQIGPMAGGLVIFAAGNSNTSSPQIGYPASYYNVIAVASTDHNDVKSSFSNYGNWIDISAPGSNVYSTFGSGYLYISGTSMACPHVSGVAALVASHLQRPGLKPAEVWNRLRLSAQPISLENPNMNGLLGAGRLDAFGALQEPDAIPPAAIQDLHTSEVHYSSITLEWTATGASGNVGQAADYEIRFSPYPITESNFSYSGLLPNSLLPPLAGEKVSLEVKNLSSKSTYYFAIKSRDIFNNLSGISNLLTVTTLSAPAPEVTINSITEQLYTGGISTKDVLIRNTGDEDELKIRLSVPDISPAPVGLASGAKGRLFAINTLFNTIEELNPKTGVVIGSIPMPEESTKSLEGLAFDGVNLYYGSNARIFKLNAHTGQVLRSFTVNNISAIRGLAWSGRYLYVSDAETNRIYEVDSDNGVILRSLVNLSSNGLTFAGKRGTLFRVVYDRLVEVNLTTGQVVNEINLNLGANITGLGYSNAEDIIFVSYGTTSIKAIQPDTGDVLYTILYIPTTALASDEYQPGWLTTNEQVISIAPGATSSLPVTFNATSLPTGQWTGRVLVIPINVNSNPETVEVTLNVTTATDIETSKEINFNKQYLGFSIDTVISIENRGYSNLIIDEIHSNDSRVATSLTSMTIAPGQKVPLQITIIPSEVGMIGAVITFTSNDPDEGELSIPVYAEVLLAPGIEVNPVTLNTTLSIGETKTLNFTAKNTGGSTLHWKANFVGASSPAFTQSTADPITPHNQSASYVQSELGEFTLIESSPEPLTCLSYDTQNDYIYAKSLLGNTFYRYDPVTNSWAIVGLTPESSIGQAAYLNGKIFLGGNQLSIYTIQSDSWTTVSFPVQALTGNLTSDGQYIYISFGFASPFGSEFYRYEPETTIWSRLADVPRTMNSFGGLSYHSGVIYAHEDAAAAITGDGNTALMKYYIESNTWLYTLTIPGKASAGSAIDPAGRKYFAVGAPHAQPGVGIQMSILDLFTSEWLKIETPFTVGPVSGLVFVGKPIYSGIYFIQGNGGTGFARYNTEAAADWISITPNQGNLAPGATQTFSVALNATVLNDGNYTGNLRVSSNSPAIEGAIPLNVTVNGAPDVSISHTTQDLGDVSIGKEAGVYLMIKNTGTKSLLVSTITSDHPDFYINNPSFSIPSGEIISLIFSYRPITTGPQTGTFTLHTNDPDESAIQFVLKGNGVYPPVANITPGILSTSLLTGATSMHDIMISNTGGSNLDYEFDFGPWIRSTNKNEKLGIIPAGQSKTINLTIDAAGKGSGTYNTTILCWHRGEIQLEIPVTMTVTGVADILTDKKSLSFGDQFINGKYDSIIQIKNDGVLPLSINTINTDNTSFTISTIAPLNLLPGESTSATIRFNPTSIGTQSGHLTFISDDPDEGSYLISLGGNGVDPPVISSSHAQITVTAFTNEAQTQTLTLNNSGGSVLKWRIIEKSSPLPSSIVGNGQIEEPMSPGDFTSKGQPPQQLISPTIDPATGLIYAQAPWYQRLFVYDPVSNNWSDVGSSAPGISFYKAGGAVILNSKMYCVYSDDHSKIHIYNFKLKGWTTMPNDLGVGTGTITTDGTLLYVAGNGNFKSFNPVTKAWINLPLPTITLDGAGGLSYYNGFIYAHEGNGNGFAKFNISTRVWQNLVALPDHAVLGSAIDPIRKRYYAYGINGSSYFYEYDIDANVWNVLNFTLFAISDGGMIYLPNSGFEGIYFIQGVSGRGFARYEPKVERTWLRAAPLNGEIISLGYQTLGINFNPYGLDNGSYQNTIRVTSNDPNLSALDIPVTFNIGKPIIKVPDEILAKIDLSSPYKNGLTIENQGSTPLQWSLANPLPDWLKTNKLSGTISGLASEYIEVTFDPTLFTPGVLDYELQINSNDWNNPKVSTRLKYTLVNNHAPVVSSMIPTQSVSFSDVQISLIENFSDSDNDPLIYSATSNNTVVATASISGSNLFINPLKSGTAIITVVATDIFNLSATTTFKVEVNQAVTGIEVEPIETSLVANPNPFSKSVMVRYQTKNPGNAKMIVVDIAGKIIWQTKEYLEIRGNNEIELDGNQLVPGIYTCLLLREGEMISKIRLARY